MKRNPELTLFLHLFHNFGERIIIRFRRSQDREIDIAVFPVVANGDRLEKHEQGFRPGRDLFLGRAEARHRIRKDGLRPHLHGIENTEPFRA